jgi:hypothetical protein
MQNNQERNKALNPTTPYGIWAARINPVATDTRMCGKCLIMNPTVPTRMCRIKMCKYILCKHCLEKIGIKIEETKEKEWECPTCSGMKQSLRYFIPFSF